MIKWLQYLWRDIVCCVVGHVRIGDRYRALDGPYTGARLTYSVEAGLGVSEYHIFMAYHHNEPVVSWSVCGRCGLAYVERFRYDVIQEANDKLVKSVMEA
jgi:hypothetical protein